MGLEIVWTENALQQLDEMTTYLRLHWGQKSVDKYLKKSCQVSKNHSTISQNTLGITEKSEGKENGYF